MLKFTVITPCFNSEKYIEQTITSVLSQSVFSGHRAELQYLICDGGSKDRTVELAKKFSHPSLTIVSEPDTGMYDALSKGLQKSTGDIVSYINAGDLYLPGAFQALSEIISNEKVRWVTGINGWINEAGSLLGSKTPFIYRNRLIKSGTYGTKLPFIQQESTFWRSDLNSLIDFAVLKTFKYAGDYFIWHSLASKAQLTTVAAQLAVFRIHTGQLSENMSAYHAEMKLFCKSGSVSDFPIIAFDRIMWELPEKIKRKLAGESMIEFDPVKNAWL